MSPYLLCRLCAVQCNTLFSARRYKLQLFQGFRRQVVVVFPSAGEWKRRLSQHQATDGEQIPETALLKLQGLTYISSQIPAYTTLGQCSDVRPMLPFFHPASCTLPELQSDLLEELQYVELPQEQAQVLLQEYKDEAHRLLPPVSKQEKKDPKLPKKRPRPRGPPPLHRMQWPGEHWWGVFRETLGEDEWMKMFVWILISLRRLERHEVQHAFMEAAAEICESESKRC